MRSQPAILWSFVLLLCLLSYRPPNPLVIFLINPVLRSCGKYSFGMYLLHPGVIDVVIRSWSIREPYRCHLTVIVGSYICGFMFYHIFEKQMIKIANYVCHRLTLMDYFQVEIKQQVNNNDTEPNPAVTLNSLKNDF